MKLLSMAGSRFDAVEGMNPPLAGSATLRVS
jgi:hypothetical protein